jgi:alpha-galactosidase
VNQIPALLAALLLAAPSGGELGRTPPIGWSSWNRFGCDIDERIVRESAAALVASGMRAAGYRYVNVDDCWMAPGRAADGGLRADPERFPSGIPALASYVHARGLRLGLYTSLGTSTCQGRPGLAGNEQRDLARLAGWRIDYLKVDYCGVSEAVKRDPEPSFRRVRRLLDASGRRVVLSISTWGQGEPWRWRAGVGQLWRVSGDIRPDWDWIVKIAGRSNLRRRFAGPGGWNDPDMLEVGNRGLSAREGRAHFGLWAMLAAPLVAGNDVRRMSPATRRTLLGRELIAVDQDRLGIQGRRLRGGRRQVWVRRLAEGGRAVLLLNTARRPALLRVDLRRLGLPAAERYRVRDLFRRRWSSSGPVLRARVGGHDARVFRIPRRR